MTDRVSTIVPLPLDMDVNVRRALSDILTAHAKQINYATGHDIITITTDASIAHDIVGVDAAAGAVTCTLMPVANWTDRTIRVKKIDSTANLVKIVAQSGETIDGTATVAISTQWTCLQLVSTGSAWWTA
jgi:hypothetical protein